MKDLGYGKDYVYAHDTEAGLAAMNCLPESLADEERGIGAWIAGLSPADEADLRGQSVERLTKFMESFPPLDRRANPVTEAAARWPNEGPILLQARVDLMIGRPVGNESRKVIIDLKTGWVAPKNREVLRFYALVETLRTGVPRPPSPGPPRA